MWQDIVITIATIIISYALIPQVIKGFKEKKAYITIQTGLLTTLALYTISTIYLTLKLFLSTTITFVSATLWLILFIQSITYRK